MKKHETFWRKTWEAFAPAAGLFGLTLTLATATANVGMAVEYTLRATANSNENDEDYDGLVVFKDFVESRSNGAIEVELFIGTQLCAKGAECLQGIAGNNIDIYISTSGGAAEISPYVQVLDLPYLLRDDRVAETVRTGDFVRELRAQALKDSGDKIRLMTIGNTGGWRNFSNTKKLVQTPKDLENLKIRTVVADLPQQLVKALGASPTPIPWPELFTSLQTGVVEGTKNGITDIMNQKFPDAGLKYLTLDGHAYMGALWWMSNESFLALPEDLRRVVINGFAELQQATFASPKRKSIAAYGEFTQKGGQIYVPTPAEKELFKEAAQPVYEWFRSNVAQGDRFYDLLVHEAQAAGARIDAANAADIN